MSAATSHMAPRVISFGGVDVYAPRCPECGDDRSTHWEHLESGPVLTAYGTRGHCNRHVGTIYVTATEAYRAREPERLAARLAELKAGAR